MQEKIFTSPLNLKMENKQVESDFQKMKIKKFKFFHFKITLFSFISSLSVMIFQYFFYEKFQDIKFFKFNLIMNSIATVMYFLLMTWSYLTKNIQIMKWIDYFIFYFQIFVIMAFRFAIIRATDASLILLFFEYLIEIIVRLIWVLLFIHSFKESFFLNTLSLVTVWIVVTSLFPEKSFNIEIINTLTYSCVITSVIVIGYILERQQKEAFYFQWQANSKAKWLTNVFENLNSGFVSIKNSKISYVNSYFKKFLQNLKIIDKFQNIENRHKPSFLTEENDKEKLSSERKDSTLELNVISEKYDYQKLNFPLQYLISRIKYDNQDCSIVNFLKEFNFNNSLRNDKFTEENSHNFFSKLANYLSRFSDEQNFQCIGDISITVEEQEYNFEVHYRIINESEMDFLFNEVSRTKMKENQQAELKYKSLFLSKIAHEFKNPLICINEIINQSFEELPKNVKKNQNLVKNLNQIKSLSNFLQILIKDLNYFSESQLGPGVGFQENETELKSVIEFCCKIAQSLLIKCNKVKEVELKVNIDQMLPEKIKTDEWRLKQLLVNLLSNSVKFTLSGSIAIDVTLVENESLYTSNRKIKFLIKDTGVGIKEHKQKNIFKPFQRDSTSNFQINNEFGSGLGLSIANEISTKLGSGLEFKSNKNEGTSFWFYIALPSEMIKEKKPNIKEITISTESNRQSISKSINLCSISLEDSSASKDSSYDSEIENSNTNYSPSKKETGYTIHSIRDSQRKESQISTRKISDLQLKFCYKSLFNKKNNERKVRKLPPNLCSSSINLNNPIMKNCNFYFNNNKKVSKKTTDNNIFNKNSINVIVADDEVFTRLSTVRVIKDISKSLGINLNILEAEDGLETIYILYKACRSGSKISLIFSDQSMNYMDGIKSSYLVNEIVNRKQLAKIPFYLVTAYEGLLFDSSSTSHITKIMNKPILRNEIYSIVENLISNL